MARPSGPLRPPEGTRSCVSANSAGCLGQPKYDNGIAYWFGGDLGPSRGCWASARKVCRAWHKFHEKRSALGKSAGDSGAEQGVRRWLIRHPPAAARRGGGQTKGRTRFGGRQGRHLGSKSCVCGEVTWDDDLLTLLSLPSQCGPSAACGCLRVACRAWRCRRQPTSRHAAVASCNSNWATVQPGNCNWPSGLCEL